MFMVVYFLFCLFTFLCVMVYAPGGQLVLSWVFWAPFSSAFSFSFLVDSVSLCFFSVIIFISGLVFLYTFFYMAGALSSRRFCWLVFGFVMSMVMLVFSGNFLVVMIGLDGLGLTSFCLVIFYSNYSSLESGLITVLSNRVGDLFYLGCFFIFFLGGLELGEIPFGSSVLLWGFLFLGAITKSAQLPFSAWLPAAMAAPTPVSSLVHSSTLVTAGVYVLLRYNYIFCSLPGDFLKGIFLFTMFLAGLSACQEMDFKKIVAMSTLSQLGLMLFVLSIGAWEMTFFHMIIHAFFKSMLFLNTGGLMMDMAGGQDSRFFGGNSFSFCSFLCFVVSSFCLMGFPFCIGFYSKDLILLSSSYFLGNMYFVVFLGACFLTVFYSFRLLKGCFVGWYSGEPFLALTVSWSFFFSVAWLFFFCWLLSSSIYWTVSLGSTLILGGVDFLFSTALIGVVLLGTRVVFHSYRVVFSLFTLGFLRWESALGLSSGYGGVFFFRWESGWLELSGGQGVHQTGRGFFLMDVLKGVSIGLLVFLVLAFSLY